jgi:hypothetical protein
MNNEPVAWMDKRTSKCVVFINTPPSEDWIPLYTHPAKTLTDEEIIEVHINTPFMDGYLNKNLIDFARAILKKAGE